MNREVIPMEDLNIVFDDRSAEEFAKKVLNGEFNSDKEAIEFMKKQLKKNHPDLNLSPDLEL